MREQAEVTRETVPLLMRYAVPRSQSEEIPGRYCASQRVWVTDKNGIIMPIISCERSISELTTKTKVDYESDDISDMALLEMTTKTHAQVESDDVTPFLSFLLEVTTKTEAQAERDDYIPEIGLDS